MFLLYTVSKLSRSCRFVKDSSPSPLQNDDLNFVLDQNELSMIISYENPLLWNHCDHKVTRNAVADMYTHIAFEDKDFSDRFLSTILTGISKSSFD